MHVTSLPLLLALVLSCLLLVSVDARNEENYASEDPRPVIHWDRILEESNDDKDQQRLLREMHHRVGDDPGIIQYALQFSGPSGGAGYYMYWATTAQPAVFTTVISQDNGPNTTVTTDQGNGKALFLADIMPQGSINTGWNFTGTGNISFGQTYNMLFLNTSNGYMTVYFGFSSATAYWEIIGGTGVFNRVVGGYVTSNMLFGYNGNVALDNHWGIILYPNALDSDDSLLEDDVRQARELLGSTIRAGHVLP